MSEGNLTVNALGSASAGIISRILTHPLDTAKARLQAPGAAYKGTFDVLRKTIKFEGATTLYRGFSAIVVGGTPGTMAYLCGYDFIKNKFMQTNNNSDVKIPEFAVHFTSGMLAETFACIIYVPVDVIKERLQVQNNIESGVGNQKHHYHGSFDALKKIMRNEGLGGIYKGYLATLASYGPYAALYFVFYERMKELSRGCLHQDAEKGTNNAELPFLHTVLCSATAGAAASWVTSPLDMAKLRLQIQRGKHATGLQGDRIDHRGMIDCLSNIYKEGGVKGLFRGAGARVLHFVPATTIMMTCYEGFRPFYANMLSK